MSGIVAIIGAECSGKTTLARALSCELGGAMVPEALRGFVDRHGRVPGAREQASVMGEQIAAEQRALGRADWVVSDSGALMTAVYSLLYYGDDTLIAPAVAHHRRSCVATLWCPIDLPWQPDPGHRDGPDYRLRAHELLRQTLRDHPIEVLPVAGPVRMRLQAALAYLQGVPAHRDPARQGLGGPVVDSVDPAIFGPGRAAAP